MEVLSAKGNMMFIANGRSITFVGCELMPSARARARVRVLWNAATQTRYHVDHQKRVTLAERNRNHEFGICTSGGSQCTRVTFTRC